ncbi:MAG: septal ring lytic transglycosylase RlpA family protein [Burkholderiales bacterium]|nr:septal ring lytic transglycosylase RlpA family protein [Burkholderiales bacterium]
MRTLRFLERFAWHNLGRVAIAALLAVLAGCSTVRQGPVSAPDAPPSSRPSGVEIGRGTASWYGPGFRGRRTASGEPFDDSDLTAAHRTLPFGSRVLVRNVRNGREVVVRINDRGPWKRGRIIDLSRAAAAALDMLQAGEAPVVLLTP